MAARTSAGAILGKETIKQYWGHTKKRKGTFFTAVFSIPVASVIFDTLVPYWLAMAIGTFTAQGSGDVSSFLLYAAIAGGTGLILNLVGFQAAMYHESATTKSVAGATMDKLLQKDVSFFSSQKIGALTSRFIDFVAGYIDILGLFILRTLNFSINMVVGVGLIFSATPVLALVILGFVVLLLVQVKVSTYLRRDIRKARRDLRSESHGVAADILTNYFTVKTFASEKNELKNFDDINDRYRKAYIRDFRWLNIEGTGRHGLSIAIQIASIAVVAGMLAAGQVELGIAIFTLAYLQRIASQIFQLGELLNGYDKVLLAATPITEILLSPPMVIDSANATELKVRKGEIDFNGVSYAYSDDKNTEVVSNLNLHIPAGQRVGLVGVSGAGKTTITKLLLRFDDIGKGAITIDGQDIASVTQFSLRQNIAYVPQDPMLFHRSLRENIAYAKPDSDSEAIMEAARRANALEFIDKLPSGLDTIVGERGVKLSGGQRQRIVIARAILKDAPILVLDEATSALDSESENLIQQALKDLMNNRTSIVVAHRLSTISKLDRIVVMDKGRVLEDGDHETLLAQNGVYAKLWKRQSGGFIEGQ